VSVKRNFVMNICLRFWRQLVKQARRLPPQISSQRQETCWKMWTWNLSGT
jgi:hypothetical protein